MEEPSVKKPNMALVAYNILAFVTYTIFSVYPQKLPGLYAIFILSHVLFCFVCAAYKWRWEWLLGGIVVLLIGLSTCANFLFK